jgi:hypothetical protein
MSDITLAVGDGARRMTYAELAAVRGKTQAVDSRLEAAPRPRSGRAPEADRWWRWFR